MVFSSLFFLFIFLPAVLLLYYLVPHGCRNIVLFLASLFFYAWGEPVYIVLILISTIVDYLHGMMVEKYRDNKRRARIFLVSSILINAGLLCFFKYADFIIDMINSLLGTSVNTLGLPLPIGISFYTFQTMSYTIDVYRGQVAAQRNFLTFGTYVALFPQLIAGPIVRYRTISGQLVQRMVNIDSFGEGVRRFICGLAKKVLLANNIGLLVKEIQQMPPQELTIVSAWLGMTAFALQIYFDFSGYSDMAIGLGRMFGFTFLENFNYPYFAQNITDFWRRWHISLGTWFREYVYIPLGGSRGSKALLLRNIFVVWFLTGLWHGASWNYVLWGLYFGMLLVLEKAFLLKWLNALPKGIRHLYAVFFILVGWVFFVYEDLSAGIQYLQVMFGLGSSGIIDSQALYNLTNYALILLAGILFSLPWPEKITKKLAVGIPVLYYGFCALMYIFLLFVCTAYLVDSTYNPFLYFRF